MYKQGAGFGKFSYNFLSTGVSTNNFAALKRR